MCHQLQNNHYLQTGVSYQQLPDMHMKIWCRKNAYWFPNCDHSMKHHHIWMLELSHDGCLLQELHSVFFQRSRLKCRYGHLHSTPRRLPHPLVYCPKLTRAEMLNNPADKKKGS